MVRVIANLSIHPEVGPDIAKNIEIVELLVQVLGTMTYDIVVLAVQYSTGICIQLHIVTVILFLFYLEVKDFTNSEELVLNTIATINNLSYYTEENTALAMKRNTVTQCMMCFLNVQNILLLSVMLAHLR